ncbi:hypothetical protein GGF46_000389 [Coemansia sp. RSA 552]|nr:hypothetical protein GGF46_000389 [Coemansia sp. RSA 552]
MASEAAGDGGFLDGCFLSADAQDGAATLVSFHFVRFILFTVMFAVAGPVVYRIVAAFFDLERDFKTVADYFDDFTNSLIYSFMVFTLGNYAHTFSWVTLVFYFVGIFGYCALVELPFMRISLPGWRTWSYGAWVVNLAGLALVLLAAAFHIYWAYNAGMLQWYLPLFVLATATVWLTVFVQWLHNYYVDNFPQGMGVERWLRKRALVLQTQVSTGRNGSEERTGASARAQPARLSGGSLHEADESDGNALGSSMDLPEQPLRERRTSSQLAGEQRRALIEEKLQNLHYLNVRRNGPLPLHHCCLHLHHWQMFYILAFFTRFDRFASRACAGIVLGIVTQGSAAYGYDAMVERKG